MIVIVLGAVIFILGGVALILAEGRGAPLLEPRSSDPSVWRFDGVDPTITAVYLEAVAVAFSLDGPKELFRLRPEDTLMRLYRSTYENAVFHMSDDMELEICAKAFEKLCGSSEAKFDPGHSLMDQLKTISRYRNNRPVTAEEMDSLGLDLEFLSALVPPELS
ncbi:MAG: hypothetical protein IJS14_13650 [Lentisphaeria bacterium]|nr:hypothetical protein [Lentisphaeria bacterium]